MPALRRFGNLVAFSIIIVQCCTAETAAATAQSSNPGYDELVGLFADWRDFEKPPFLDGVPDYTAEAMASQYRELARYQRRLADIDPSSWPVSQQVDYYLVRAEMNGLDFDHRVRRPWARNPAFYVTIYPSQSDVPAHEGPVIHGWVDLWTYAYPLTDGAAAELADAIATIPARLEQARVNLVEDARDLWIGGIRATSSQRADLESLARRVAGTSEELDAAIAHALEATESFRGWLEAELPSKRGLSGVGRDNYTWYLQNVHLVPYSWEEEVTLMRHELSRAHAALALEEHRNRNLPPLEMIDTAEEYDRRSNESVDEFMTFLEEAELVTVRDYMDAALRAKIGSFTEAPPDGLRGFFNEIIYREPLAMRTHMYHWIELANMEQRPHPSPIRRVPSLYNIFDARSEGLATGVEEWLMLAGMFDDRPRARELIYIMLAQRAARALAGLMMHGQEYTIEEATELAAKWTPRGWMPPDSDTVWGEQHLYLAQPGYGTSYLVGKIQIEALMAERARAMGETFTIRGFMDELSAAGVIPVSLVRWELTGDDEAIRPLR